MLNRCDCARNLPCHKSFAATRALVIEQNAVAGVQPVALAIIHGRPIRKNFCHAIGAAWPKRRLLTLRPLLRLAEHLAARGLIKTRAQSSFANRLQNANRADSI